MITKAEKQKWQAEEDASIMASYQEILKDKNRMARATKVAREKAKALTERAAAMQSVAKITRPKKK